MKHERAQHALRPGTFTLTGIAPMVNRTRTVIVHDGTALVRKRNNGEVEVRITARFHPNAGAAVSVFDRESFMRRLARKLGLA